MKATIVGLMVLGLIAAVSAALLMSAMMARDGTAEATEAPEEPEVEVVVATRSLDAMHEVAPEDVEMRPLRESQVPEGAERSAGSVVGRMVSRPMAEGEAFTQRSFAREGPGVHLARSLPEGMRAVSVPMDSYSGLDGLLYPGSRVDVIALIGERRGNNTERASTTLLHGVQVLGVQDRTIMHDNDDDDEEEGSSGRSRNQAGRVTLMVDPEQLRALQLAMDHGSVTLALRNPSDETLGEGVTRLGELTGAAPVLASDQLAQLRSEMQESFAAMLNERTGEQEESESQRGGTWDVQVIRGGQMETQQLETGS